MLKLLNDRSGYFLSQLERCECVLSARKAEGRRVPNNQTLVFVRDEQSRLPGNLVIGYERQADGYLPWKVNRDPLFDGHG